MLRMLLTLLFLGAAGFGLHYISSRDLGTGGGSAAPILAKRVDAPRSESKQKSQNADGSGTKDSETDITATNETAQFEDEKKAASLSSTLSASTATNPTQNKKPRKAPERPLPSVIPRIPPLPPLPLDKAETPARDGTYASNVEKTLGVTLDLPPTVPRTEAKSDEVAVITPIAIPAPPPRIADLPVPPAPPALLQKPDEPANRWANAVTTEFSKPKAPVEAPDSVSALEQITRGMLFKDARSLLLNSGWQPRSVEFGERPELITLTEMLHLNAGYDELVNCSDEKRALCRFEFTSEDGSIAAILSRGETAEDGRVIDAFEMSVPNL